MPKQICIPLPNCDFDLTEVAVPWMHFVKQGFHVTFSTEQGMPGATDPLLIKGVIFGQLGAKPDAIRAYRKLENDPHFLNPIRYDQIDASKYDALLLPGGHAKGMRPYLENEELQRKVLDFFRLNKIIGAICHGPIVLARTIEPVTGKSVIYNKRITALPKALERIAYYLTFWKHGKYYRTYPEYVQDEITRQLKEKHQFTQGPSQYKPFVVEDGNLITARWPLDAHLFAQTLIRKLE
ncbi:DJ-1/PfpI family protein [Paenibacillus sp. HN-1]|uniref:type 1 glutamine amidotransferase domain-containing protein n=1 Tax=Paenibacillus TaxID=44249 RepID=UPI001CA9E99B|nr:MULTISPECIES: type 1 glutamine amidotransferase domain-containing protein [Paenibacillus]MBY9079205.1 DJ-1/PfpI family protein [Paenibacillus sp. CGMCC 1.18879]MBY9087368.1 DJ-1/PfpI family protein [Paenibacillus sinensis]